MSAKIYFLGAILGLAGLCLGQGATQPGQPATGEKPMSITVKSDAFANAQVIPRKYTGEGEDISPPLSWSAPPAGTKELALICDDPDAPAGAWVHWVVYRIPADATSLPEGASAGKKNKLACTEGKTSWGTPGYQGPLPPKGHGTHHYHFRLYALDQPLSLKPNAAKADLLAAMKGHILAQGELMGTYERK